MTYIQSFILGIIQGLTEFLPISSSAHLVLIPYLFNWVIPEEQIFPFDVLVQMGTLIAVIIYFWNDLMAILKGFFRGLANKEPFKELEARMGWFLIVATIPAGILGMLIKNQVEAAFANPTVTALFLFATAGLLLLSDLVGKRSRSLAELTWWDALWIGLFQSISIFPGISRSGATIAGGMTHNLDRSSAARFSFLMSIPVMFGASLVSLQDLFAVPNLNSFLPILLVGFFAAVITGYLSIHWLLSFIKRHKFYVFAIYCVIFACIILLVGALRTVGVSAGTPTPVPATSASSTAGTESVTNSTSSTGFQMIDISYSPAVEWMIPSLSGCAGVIGNSGLVTHKLPTTSLDIAKTDLVIRWGAPESLTTPATQLGTDNLVIATNLENPLVSLDSSTSRKLFSGQYKTWSDLYQACPDCFDQNYDGSLDASEIKLGFYPKEEDIQDIFDRVIMNDQPVAGAKALLIPDPQAMVEFLQGEKSAIGFLPGGMMNDNLKEIRLTDYDPGSLIQPLLVLSQSSPQRAARELLVCTQNVINQ